MKHIKKLNEFYDLPEMENDDLSININIEDENYGRFSNEEETEEEETEEFYGDSEDEMKERLFGEEEETEEEEDLEEFGEEEDEDEDDVLDDRNQIVERVMSFKSFNEKKKEKEEEECEEEECEEEDKKEVKLSAKQKKLPEGMQKAILAKMKKK